MPFPLAIVAIAVAGKAAVTTWAVTRWRERPLARIRRAVTALAPINVTLLRVWPDQDLYRVVIDARAYFVAEDLTYGIQSAPGHQGRVALSVIWADEDRHHERSASLPAGVNPQLEAAIALAYLGQEDIKADILEVAKNKIPK